MALIQTALRTGEIESEKIDVASVRYSFVRHLDLEHAGFVDKRTGLPAATNRHHHSVVDRRQQQCTTIA